jgi:hypothetical protein
MDEMKNLIVVSCVLLLLVSVLGCGGARLGAKATVASQIQAAGFGDASGARVLFRDDFEDAKLDDWEATRAWAIEMEGDSNSLIAAGSGEAAWVPQGTRWTDYFVRAGVSLESGAVALAFRASREGSYWLLFREDGLYLLQEYPKGNYTPLTQTEAPNLNAWHVLAIGGYGDQLQVYVDRELQIDYTDSSPLTEGTIGIAAIESGRAAVDNVLAAELTEALPTQAAEAALPPTVAPPSVSSLEEEWQPLEEWSLEEETSPSLVERTPAPVEEPGWVEEETLPEGEFEWIEEDD